MYSYFKYKNNSGFKTKLEMYTKTKNEKQEQKNNMAHNNNLHNNNIYKNFRFFQNFIRICINQTN